MSNQIKFKNNYEVLEPNKTHILEVITLENRCDSRYYIDDKYYNSYLLTLKRSIAKGMLYTTLDLKNQYDMKCVNQKEYEKLKEEYNQENNDNVLFTNEAIENANVLFANEIYKKTSKFYFGKIYEKLDYAQQYHKYYNIINTQNKSSFDIIKYIKQCKKIIVHFLENSEKEQNKSYGLKNKELRFYIVLDDECKDKYEKYLLSRNLAGDFNAKQVSEYFISTFKDTFKKYDFMVSEDKLKNTTKEYLQEDNYLVGYFFRIVVMPDISYAPKDIQEIYKGIPQEEVISKKYNKKVGFLICEFGYYQSNNIVTDYYTNIEVLKSNMPITNQEYYTFDNVDFVSIKNNYTIEKILGTKSDNTKKTIPSKKNNLFAHIICALGILWFFWVLFIFFKQ
ncbi:hypothetical protein [Campylobacter sp. RM12651]|uniref:hypothetical protein n=1 Tax=Campylobacter sp. RM12651 TaxID=1660079 RepID=UPI001EFB9FBA|nr:hypothetical protein [Campylobacter sp. RM12651]ULO03773.1 hypothetical protein AVBRAN_1319 [Campylobacter sp. RM12651]